MALRPVLVDTKDTQISANWGKQWGKHYPHFATFFCTGLHWQNAKTLTGTAFQRIVKNGYEAKLDPSGPRKEDYIIVVLFLFYSTLQLMG
jgi:hypothetical protein